MKGKLLVCSGGSFYHTTSTHLRSKKLKTFLDKGGYTEDSVKAMIDVLERNQHYSKNLIDQWKANSTQEEFKEVLDSICKKLGQPDRINRLGITSFIEKAFHILLILNH